MKHSSTLFLRAQVRILVPRWADRLSKMMWIGAPSGRAARMDFSAARVFAADFLARATPHRVSSPKE